jgi:hypothetical protein
MAPRRRSERRKNPRRNRNGQLAPPREPESSEEDPIPIVYNRTEVDDMTIQFENASLEPSQLPG